MKKVSCWVQINSKAELRQVACRLTCPNLKLLLYCLKISVYYCKDPSHIHLLMHSSYKLYDFHVLTDINKPMKVFAKQHASLRS